MKNYIQATKAFLEEIINEGFYENGLKFNLVNTTPWDYELPEGMRLGGNIIIDVKGWSLEQSYVVDEGVFIQTAFGEDEYSKVFLYDEIINIITFDGNVLYQKTIPFGDMETKEVKKVSKGKGKTPRTIGGPLRGVKIKKSLIGNDTKGLELSMSKLSLRKRK